MTCRNCGGHMYGDGFLAPFVCEVRPDYGDRMAWAEPDSGPWYCEAKNTPPTCLSPVKEQPLAATERPQKEMAFSVAALLQHCRLATPPWGSTQSSHDDNLLGGMDARADEADWSWHVRKLREAGLTGGLPPNQAGAQDVASGLHDLGGAGRPVACAAEEKIRNTSGAGSAGEKHQVLPATLT